MMGSHLLLLGRPGASSSLCLLVTGFLVCCNGFLLCHSFAIRSQPLVLTSLQSNLPSTRICLREAASSHQDLSDTTKAAREEGPVLDDFPSAFQPLFTSAAATTAPRNAVTTSLSHDPFRFEWGTWVDNDALMELMDRVNEIRCIPGAFDDLVATYPSTSESEMNHNVRLRVAGGQDWDVILHVLPQGSYWRGRWPTGSWAIVKPLTGVTEVAMLRESNYRKATSKDLRGGSDGSLGGGGAFTAGEDCVKYVGGPIRSYTGKSGKTILLEVIVRPPTSFDEPLEDMESLQELSSTLTVVELPKEEGKQSDSDEKVATAKSSAEPTKASSVSTKDQIRSVVPTSEEKKGDSALSTKAKQAPSEKKDTIATNLQKGETEQEKESEDLGSALGMTFDKVGGLDQQLDAIARRVLASRANPAAARRLGVSHVRGILLSGPPGCGKTLLARELARLLNAREPQIVNGPEILDKFIGEAEKKVRALFGPAEREYAEVGEESALHIIILDEMDAIAKKRGTASSDTTGVRDSVVNQLLSCMDVSLFMYHTFMNYLGSVLWWLVLFFLTFRRPIPRH
jgi:hypothetical protein